MQKKTVKLADEVNGLLALKALIEDRIECLNDMRDFNWDAGAVAAKNYAGSGVDALCWARSMLVSVLCEEPPVMRAAVALMLERKMPLRAARARVYAGAK